MFNYNGDPEQLRKDGLQLFSKLIRTKNVDGLQEHAHHREHSPTEIGGKPKLTVRKHKKTTHKTAHEKKSEKLWWKIYFRLHLREFKER